MAALTFAALLFAASPAEEQERYEIAIHLLQTEVARYEVTLRDYERRIRAEPDDDRAKELRERQQRYKRGTGALLEGIWIEVQKLKRKTRPVPLEAA